MTQPPRQAAAGNPASVHTAATTPPDPPLPLARLLVALTERLALAAEHVAHHLRHLAHQVRTAAQEPRP